MGQDLIVCSNIEFIYDFIKYSILLLVIAISL